MEGEEFKRRRKAIGYDTRPKAATSIGCEPDTIKKWESGINPVSRYAVRWLLRQEHENGKARAHQR